jgi:hypothetical protein
MIHNKRKLGWYLVSLSSVGVAALITFWMTEFIQHELKYNKLVVGRLGLPFAVTWMRQLASAMPLVFAATVLVWIARLLCPHRLEALQLIVITAIGWIYLLFVAITIIALYVSQQTYVMY